MLLRRLFSLHLSMEISIKKTEDFEGISKIAVTLKEYFDAAGLKSIEEDSKTDQCFGAYVDEKLVGFVMYKEINPETIELAWTGVLAEFQGMGVGTKLIYESLAESGKIYKVCEVKTLSDIVDYKPYEKTRSFYKKIGFVPIETIHPYPGWTDPCQIFVKFLNK